MAATRLLSAVTAGPLELHRLSLSFESKTAFGASDRSRPELFRDYPAEPFRRSELRDFACFANRWSVARSRWSEPLVVRESPWNQHSLI